MMSPEERAAEIQRLRAAMISQDYYLMQRRLIAAERKAAVVLEHFQWLVRLEKEGRILLTGAIFLRDGTQAEGLTIFRTDSWEAADALAASDPFIVAGANAYHLERFRLGAGRLTVSLDCSDQSFRLI